MQRAYTSTVMGPAYLAAGVLGAAGFGAVTATAGGPVWVTVPGVMAMVITSIHVSTVRLSIGAGRIVVGQGPWGRRARVIPVGAVVSPARQRHTAAGCLAFAQGNAGRNPARAIEAAITGPVTTCGDRA